MWNEACDGILFIDKRSAERLHAWWIHLHSSVFIDDVILRDDIHGNSADNTLNVVIERDAIVYSYRTM
jgi:hypothetical protein